MLKQRLLMAAARGSTPPSSSYKMYGVGDEPTGAMGNGSTTSLTSVTRIGALSTWAKIYTSKGNVYVSDSTQPFSFAIKSDGTLWACGSNANGATGLNTSSGNTTTWTQVGSATNWAQVACSNCVPNFALGIKTDGTLWGWGDNSVGQLGNGTTGAGYLVPTQIGSATNWKQVTCNGDGVNSGVNGMFSLAIKTDGTLWSCGSNASGATGQGTITGNTTTWTQVGSSTLWKQVSAGSGCGSALSSSDPTGFAIATRTDGTLWGCGMNQNANIDNSLTNYTTFVQIGSSTFWSYGLAGGGAYTMVIKNDGTLWSCGSNRDGQTGQGTTSGKTTALTQIGSANTWSMIDSNGYRDNNSGFSLAMRTDGTVWAWGANRTYNIGTGSSTPNAITAVTQIGSATTYTAIAAGGPGSSAVSGGLFSLLLST